MTAAFLLLIAFTLMNADPSNSRINFGRTADRVQDWVKISDNVMGGVTTSRLEYTDNSMVLSGNISLDNYGGFSSVKTRFKNFDLSEFNGLRVRFRSTNQRFAFTLEDSRNWTQPNYKGEFLHSKENTWTETTIYFKDFKEYQIGEPTGEKLNLASLKDIIRLGIITTEKKEGPFSLEVDYIEFFR